MKSFSKYDPAMALRAFKVRFGERGMKTSSIETATEGVSVDGDSTVEDTVNYADAGESTVIVDDTPAPVNEDVWRRNFWRHKGMTKLRRLWRRLRRVGEFVKRFRDPKLSRDEHLWRLLHLREWNEDDLEDHRRRKEAARLHAFHVSQAKILKPRIIETLTRLKFATIHIRSDREYVRRRPHITRVDVSPYAYTFYVSVARLVGVKETDMVTDEVATILSISMQKKVRAELDAVAGLRYTVMIASTLTVPNFVSFDDVTTMPKNLPPLGLFLGAGPNGKPIYRDLAEAPHLLIGGGSGNGKSNAENMIAGTLIRRNSPNYVQLVFFDLKGGVEFGMYEDLPHLFKKRVSDDVYCDGIVEFPEQAVPAFDALLAECNERLGKLKKAKVRNIAEYNKAKQSKRLPYIVVMVDEWATTKKLAGDKVEKVLEVVANLSRATGIHFVLASQNPKSEIINTTITVNFQWRLAFGMSTAASQAMLGNWNAFGLSPKGRCIFQSSDGEMEIQTPRITNAAITGILNEAKTGERPVQVVNVDVGELLDWALENTGGKLDERSTFEQFKDRITMPDLRDMLRSMENEVFDVRGTSYKIRPGYANFPRRMERDDQKFLADRTSHAENPQNPPATSDQPVTESDSQ